jgi:hypothetical protein
LVGCRIAFVRQFRFRFDWDQPRLPSIANPPST